jgi:hypothetical protein
MEIWKMNIDRLRLIEKERAEDPRHQGLQINEQEILRFASDRFSQPRQKFRWNGRQIRNAFQIASSLAHFDARKDNIQPRLTGEHFRMIQLVTEDFDKFMQETKGKTDGELAFDRGDRADYWSPNNDRPDGFANHDGLPSGPIGRFEVTEWPNPPPQRGRAKDHSTQNDHYGNTFQSLWPLSPRSLQQRSQSGRLPSFSFQSPPTMFASGRDNSHRYKPNNQETNSGDSGQDERHFSQERKSDPEISMGRCLDSKRTGDDFDFDATPTKRKRTMGDCQYDQTALSP